MRTKLSTCARKARFRTEDEARTAIRDSGLALHPYRCDRGDHFHLTSRTRGKADAHDIGCQPPRIGPMARIRHRVTPNA